MVCPVYGAAEPAATPFAGRRTQPGGHVMDPAAEHVDVGVEDRLLGVGPVLKTLR